MPPPAPMKPHMNPTTDPPIIERIAFCLPVACANLCFGAMTGLTMNLMPSSRVMKTEKFPMVVCGTRLATPLPTNVKASTDTIMITPFFMSRFRFRAYVTAEAALASTSLAKAIPTAMYGSICRNVISMGLMTAAALMPAKPVPTPAPKPASMQIMTFSKADHPLPIRRHCSGSSPACALCCAKRRTLPA